MDIQKMISDYTHWLKNEITFERIGEYYEITTPFLDNANDYLQLYVRQDGDNLFFTDDGATINNLKMSGLQLTAIRKSHLNRILKQYGVTLSGDELTIKATSRDFPQKKHQLIQAMLRVDDMFAMSKSKVSSLFLDDIQDFFDQKDIFYADNVQFTGISGFVHSYDFLLQRTRNNPERLCQAVNIPNKTSMSNILFSWNDTKPVRKPGSELIAILNDQNNIARGIEDAFINYDAKVIRWSERNKAENLAILSAS